LSKLAFQKTNRVFNKFKNYSWIMVPVIAIGGMYIPKLGLLLIPIMLTLMVLGFLKGKYWCGNLCPHGSLFDKILLSVSPNGRIPGLFTSKVMKVAFFLFYMGMFGSRLAKAFSYWGSMTFLDRLGFVFAANYLIPTIVGTTLALFVNPRSWCTFCPMGTFEELAYKLGTFTGFNRKTDKKVTSAQPKKCTKCGKCSRVCPMQLAPYRELSLETNQFNNVDCIRCSTCVYNCPTGILIMANAEEASQYKNYRKRSIA
jgi:polyferredoxin